MDKVELLTRVLQAADRGLTMIFARTKRTVQRVADDLADRGFAAAAVHGDLGQGAREQALRAFRSGKVDVLVATDVAARGIDVTDVTHVINYQCPEDAKTYVHRIGRTGRAGKEGVAVTLVDWDEHAPLEADQRRARARACRSRRRPTPPPSTCSPTWASRPARRGRLPLSQRTRAGLDAEYVDTEGDQGGGRKRRDRSGRDRKRRRTATDDGGRRARRPRRDRARTRSRAGVIAVSGAEAGTAGRGRHRSARDAGRRRAGRRTAWPAASRPHRSEPTSRAADAAGAAPAGAGPAASSSRPRTPPPAERNAGWHVNRCAPGCPGRPDPADHRPVLAAAVGPAAAPPGAAGAAAARRRGHRRRC